MTMSFDEAVAAVTAPGQMFSVVETEVLGRPTKVYENALPSLRSLFDLARTREGTFLVYEDERLDFADVMAQVDALAACSSSATACRRATGSPSACATTPSGSSPFAAITSIGAIVVSLNAWWTERRAGTTASRTRGATVLIADQERVERAAPRSTRSASRTVVVRSTGDAAAGADRWDDVVVPGAPMPTSRSTPTTTPRSSTRRAPPAPEGRGVDPPGRRPRRCWPSAAGPRSNGLRQPADRRAADADPTVVHPDRAAVPRHRLRARACSARFAGRRSSS